MQGYPLDMVAYGIGIILMIKHVNLTYPGITQPWYADNAGLLGTFDDLE